MAAPDWHSDEPTQALAEAIFAALGAEEPFDAEQVLGLERTTARIFMYVEGCRYTLTVEADHA